MVTGPQGLNTHSSHWYSYQNGHLVSLFSSSLLLGELLGFPLRGILFRHTDDELRAICGWRLQFAGGGDSVPGMRSLG